MNIFITNHCPRKCSFCFARSRIGLSTEQENADIMTRENIRRVMDFLERSEEYQLRLLGGEPTTPPSGMPGLASSQTVSERWRIMR